MEQSNTLRVPGRYDQVRVICDFISVAAAGVGFDEDAVFRLALACDEAATNIIEHAYGAEGVGQIRVSWHVENRRFIVTLSDHGHAFDPDAVEEPLPPDPDHLEQLQAGGLGMHIMRQIMDDVYYQFDADAGNTLVMMKKLDQETST
jgi:anti-sigma regulatory factor (Ser/Thr protein kinase)